MTGEPDRLVVHAAPQLWRKRPGCFSLDLLYGRMNHSHPARHIFVALGFPSVRIDELYGGDMEPDLLGFHHYVTSGRFLDHHQPLPGPAHGRDRS
jgi:hypothetical protein